MLVLRRHSHLALSQLRTQSKTDTLSSSLSAFEPFSTPKSSSCSTYKVDACALPSPVVPVTKCNPSIAFAAKLFKKVLLPAPFSPTRAYLRPETKTRSTSSKICFEDRDNDTWFSSTLTGRRAFHLRPSPLGADVGEKC
eukprot:Lithocolla_globosa_v1_NODE_809_length_3248_cov_20.154400.p4 type:complete len:139 gc:universal NODE_809_length_3248_cov_20.154400:602-186(-)